MAVTRIAGGLHMVGLGAVNAYLLETPDGLVLIDAGLPNKEGLVLDAIRGLGKGPADLKHVLLTHAHVDHVGSLAAIVRATGAKTWLHPDDRAIVEKGSGFRPMRPAPGIVRQVMFRLFVRPGQTVEPAAIDFALNDGDVVPLAGGLQVVHVPGHCLGQVALLWRDRGVLFCGDAFANLGGVGDPIGFEDQAEGRRSQKRLAALGFEIACFGHGKPTGADASARFARRFGS